MATTLEIIKGIAQAAANAYDGSHEASLNADGEARKVGLKREEGHLINDRRVADGFKIQFNGPFLRIVYSSETRLQEVTKGGFEDEMVSMLSQIASFLKKEYKKVTGDTLTLTADGEMDAIVQNTSRVRSWVQASKWYKIGGLKDVTPVGEASEERLDKSFRDWLSLGKKTSKPKNVTRKKD